MRINSISTANYYVRSAKTQKDYSNYSTAPKHFLKNNGFDQVSFGRINGNLPMYFSDEKYIKTTVPLNVDLKTTEFVANSLSTSTSGHRADWESDKLNS